MSIWAYQGGQSNYTVNGTATRTNASSKVMDGKLTIANSTVHAANSVMKNDFTLNSAPVSVTGRQCLVSSRVEQQLGSSATGTHSVQQSSNSESVEFSYDSLHLNVPLHEEYVQPDIAIATSGGNPNSIALTDETTPSTSAGLVQGDDDDGEEIDIQIRNVVCNYTLPLHIDLHRVALSSGNVAFDRGRGVLLKQKRNPSCYVKIYSSGKVYIVGCRSEDESKRAARGIARMVQKSMGRLGDVVRIRNYRVCNVLATCKMPFGIKIEELAQKHPECSQYEPELSVGLVWRSADPRATLRIHTTGSITVTGAASEIDVMRAIEIIYPIVKQFRCVLRLRGGNDKRIDNRHPKRQHTASSVAAVPKRPRVSQPAVNERRRYGGTSGVVGNRVYFSDEDDDDEEEDEFEDVV